jgi:hypothetical protein
MKRSRSDPLRDLFDVGDEDGPETHAQLDAKIASLAAVIDDQEPHVVGLQEIGSESAPGKLQAALTTPMPHRAIGEPDERGIRWRSSAAACFMTQPRSGRSPRGCCRSRWGMTRRGQMGLV